MSASGPPGAGPRRKVRLGQLLVENDVISEAQLEAALAEQKRSGQKLGRTLMSLGHLDEDRLLDFLSKQFHLPFVDLSKRKIDPEVVRALPETHARRLRALVIEDRGDSLLVGVTDPTNIFTLDELDKLLSKPVQHAVVRESDLLRAVDLVYRRTAEIENLAQELSDELAENHFSLPDSDSLDAGGDTAVAKLLRTIFEDAIQVRASDVHIEPGEGLLRIRQRIDGVLHEQVMREASIAPALVLRLKLISGLDISEKRLPQDGRFHMVVKGHEVDVRISTMPVQNGESVVMRLLDQSDGTLSLAQLGMPEKLSQRFAELIRRPHGLILVTGPTGSGKTTTLYSALHELNQPEKKIITVEDPVEYRLPRINQVQVNPKIDLTFARVLRASLRQDPDIVMVGEIRDRDTAEIALRAALTGHLVFSTLHTNDAITSAIRLIDMGTEGYLVASSVLAVVAQRLVRRICDGCARAYEPTDQERAWLASLVGDRAREIGFRQGGGCTRCNQTGYRGRVGVYELLEIDTPLADCLRLGDTAGFARAARTQPGFRPLALRALAYAASGVTSLEEVLRVAGEVESEPAELAEQSGGAARIDEDAPEQDEA